ncbi:MAG: Nre family DNA repair protein [Thermoplasmata archaeon]
MKKTENLIKTVQKNKLCVICKGEKLLCGKSSCPLMLRYYKLMNVTKEIGMDLEGSSPPSIFVGREDYPKVNIGPLVSTIKGNTESYDLPEQWGTLDFEQFVQYRSSLVRGMKRMHVYDTESKFSLQLQDLILSKSSVDSELVFESKPVSRIVMDDQVQPFGPSGRISKFSSEGNKTDFAIEKYYYDSDISAKDAMFELFKNNVYVTKISRALSAGMFGVKKHRKFVPTRWSITAVDDTISKLLLDRIKSYPTIDNIRVYESNRLGNRFLVILLPRPWSYELVEAWTPGTLWNPVSDNTFIIADHEYHDGKKEYAQIGGCYYASRLAIAEMLEREKKQAQAIVLREATPSYIMPVGVWNVRENVRNALTTAPIEIEELSALMKHIESRFNISIKHWKRESELLRYNLYQKTLV